MTSAKQKKEKNVGFTYKADPGQRVFIAGTFNEWEPKELELKDSGSGDYSISLKLPAGVYEYKFIVNGDWVLDQANENTVCNDCGSLNNVIVLD